MRLVRGRSGVNFLRGIMRLHTPHNAFVFLQPGHLHGSGFGTKALCALLLLMLFLLLPLAQLLTGPAWDGPML